MRTSALGMPAPRVLAGAVIAFACAAGCRDAPPPGPPGSGPGTTPATPASAVLSAALSAALPAAPPSARGADRPDMQPGARLYYAAQQTIDPPAELSRFVPPAFPNKVVERNRGRGMELMRLAPGRRFATLTLLTLQPAEAALQAVATHAEGLGFTADTTVPAERALVHPNGERLVLAFHEVEGQPMRILLRLTGAEGAALPTPPPVAPLEWGDPEKLAVMGFEETLLHGIAAGGRVTDVSREALIVRAPNPAARARVLAAWEKALGEAGCTRSATRRELWERPATQEIWLIRPTDDPSGDVVLSHQRRWKRG